MNYSFSISILFLFQKNYMAQPLQTASTATDEQLQMNSLFHLLLHKKSDCREGEKEREKKEPQKLRNKDRKKRECDRKRRAYERRQKHRELETIADKESRLLTRRVHM